MENENKAAYADAYKMNSSAEVYLHKNGDGFIDGLASYEWNGNASSGKTYFEITIGDKWDGTLQEAANHAVNTLIEKGRNINNKYYEGSEGLRFRLAISERGTVYD